MKHRGRIQAQGKNLEESESWSQDKPLTKDKGLEILEKLENKLPKKEAKKRIGLFQKAKKYIEQALKNGGLFARASTNIHFKQNKRERIDIEVHEGCAFVENNKQQKQ